MTDSTRDSSALASAPTSAGRGPLIVVIALFALLFGVEIFEAVSNAIALPLYFAALGIVEFTPWALIVAGLIVPIVLFVGALILGRRRVLFARTLILIIALAASNATALALSSAVPYVI